MPNDVATLKRSFYLPSSDEIDEHWNVWLQRWRDLITAQGDLTKVSIAMKQANPSVTWREWLIAPAYQQAEHGNPQLINELQQVFSKPYQDLSEELATKYDRLRPQQFFNAGGISHYSCSS